MTAHEQRRSPRDTLLLLADLRLGGVDPAQRVRVRNLSARGMMAEGASDATRGTAVEVNIRNIGWIKGAIAWIQDERCGIAFCDDIDPHAARAPIARRETTGYLEGPRPAGAERKRLRRV
jgi:hypothetical protein